VACLLSELPQALQAAKFDRNELTLWVDPLKLLEALRAEKMLTVQAGDNVVRLLPPLIIGEAEIELAGEKLEAACAALAKVSAPA